MTAGLLDIRGLTVRFETPKGIGRAAEMLATVGLPSGDLDRYPHEFSGG